MPYTRPVGNVRISDSFQGHRNRKPPSTEPGTDYACGRGTPVRAPAAGRVDWVKTSTSGAMGRRIMLHFDDGNWASGIHLSSIRLGQGQRFAAGDIVAYSGGSARGSETGVGAHLHWTWWPGRGNSAPTPGSTTPSDYEAFLASGGNGGVETNVVKQRQDWLKQRGYYNGDIDGDWGPKSIQACKDYQQFLRGWGYTGDIDGIWGPGTQAAHQKYWNSLQASTGGGNTGGNRTSRPTSDIQLLVGVVADGVYGPNTVTGVAKWQEANGLKSDGIWGPASDGVGFPAVGWKAVSSRSVEDIQRIVGVTPDGAYGPDTTKAVAAWQRVRLLGPDGVWGPKTEAKYLAEQQGQPTPQPSGNPYLPLVVDGKQGPATNGALQFNLGLRGPDVDGDWGPKTTRALQAAVGAKVDGNLGPQTIKALQINVGADPDGQMGPDTITKLQQFLNAQKTFKVAAVEPEIPPVVYPRPEQPTYPLAASWNHSSNCSPRRPGDKVKRFIYHHIAAFPTTDMSNIDRFMKANDRQVSPNWYISATGNAHEIVPPDGFRAWTTGQIDYESVTVETQNTSGAPGWELSDQSKETIAHLAAWACVRYGLGRPQREGTDRLKWNFIGHGEIPGQSTACPGPDAELDAVCARAGVIYDQMTQPTPPVDPKPIEYVKIRKDIYDKFIDSVEDLARDAVAA